MEHVDTVPTLLLISHVVLNTDFFDQVHDRFTVFTGEHFSTDHDHGKFSFFETSAVRVSSCSDVLESLEGVAEMAVVVG